MVRKVIRVSKEEKENLKKYFYEFYLYSSWFFKYKALDSIIRNYDEFLKTIAHKDFKKAEKEVVLRSLKSEVFFTFFHMTEALFSLMLAISRKGSNPWLRLRALEPKELNQSIGDIANGRRKFTDSRLMYYFYYGADMKLMDAHGKEIIRKSLEFIRNYLVVIAKKYADKELYNIYKHGMSCMVGKAALKWEKDGKFTDLGEKVGLAYLSLDKWKEKGVRYMKIKRGYRIFEYEKYLEFCRINHGLIRNIINPRRQIVKGKRRVLCTTFQKKDIDKIRGGAFDDLCLRIDLKILFQKEMSLV